MSVEESGSRLLNYKIPQFPNHLDAPEIIFLLGLLVLGIADRHRNSELIRLRPNRKRYRRLRRFRFRHLRGSVNRSRLRLSKRLYERRRRSGWLVRVANQFQQMVIFYMFDLVRETDKAAVDIIQRPAIEFISQLFASDAESVSSR